MTSPIKRIGKICYTFITSLQHRQHRQHRRTFATAIIDVMTNEKSYKWLLFACETIGAVPDALEKFKHNTGAEHNSSCGLTVVEREDDVAQQIALI